MSKRKRPVDELKEYMLPHSDEVKAAFKVAHDSVSESYWTMWDKELQRSIYRRAIATFIKAIKRR